MLSRFSHVVVCVGMSLFFEAESYSIVCMFHVLFTHSSVDGQLDHPHLLAAVTNDVMTTGVHASVYSLPPVLLGIYTRTGLFIPFIGFSRQKY